jgi:hypothetical protein
MSGDGLLEVMLRGGDPATVAGYDDAPPRMGFFTDTLGVHRLQGV